jgi:hypothetical protein
MINLRPKAPQMSPKNILLFLPTVKIKWTIVVKTPL